MTGPTSSSQIADDLVELATTQLTRAHQSFAPGFVLPRVFGGHVVGPDARADLAFTLGLLLDAGVTQIEGFDIEPVIIDILSELDGPGTHSFYSYRAAETVERLGGWHDNPRLAGLSASQRAELEEAMDSSSFVDLIAQDKLPNNYKIVISRCEEARRRLGLLPAGEAEAVADGLLQRSRDVLSDAAHGWIDDSNDGRGQFDIYTADMFLFAEPMADDLGDVWSDGFRRVTSDVAALAQPGGAIVWGRSVGALGIAMTIELAAVSIGRGLTDDVAGWLGRAEHAVREIGTWFNQQGVLDSHANRSTMYYRGPERRLQMTYDILGKLLQAAAELRSIDNAISADAAFGPIDAFVSMRPAGDAGAWSHRGAVNFVLPLVAALSSDYVAGPRGPGVFEQPTTGPCAFVPVVHRNGKRLQQVSVPTSISHTTNALDVTLHGWQEFGGFERREAEHIEGHRRARFSVTGRTLTVDESLQLDAEPTSIDALSISIPEVAGRRLRVEVDSAHPYRVDRVEVGGLAEWRSFWGPIDAVHQIDVAPAQTIELTWSVTPFPKVGSTIKGHHYNESLYEPMRHSVDDVLLSGRDLDNVAALTKLDIVHCHWPEWLTGIEPERTADVLHAIKRSGAKILWTMHNLEPHMFKTDDARACYQLWAEAADVVIHHTQWGMGRALETYTYGSTTEHHVVPHGHWGDPADDRHMPARSDIEASHALPPCAIRLGVVGAPRAEKDVQLVLDAFAATDRDDMQLCVFSMQGEAVPDDPRIHTWDYRMEPHALYRQRLNMLDVLVLPFDDGMLLTGTAFDAIGAGKAALVSAWPMLHETLGDAGIRYGSTVEDLTAAIAGLTTDDVVAASAAACAQQATCEWSESAAATLAIIDELASRD